MSHFRKTDSKTGRFVKSSKSDLERFEDKYIPVTESGCWLWIGSIDSNGYGTFHNHKYGKSTRASRFSLELYKNQVAGNLFVLHKCDVKLCVNPDHLYIGTQVDNMQDRIKRKRVQMPYGERHHWTKLTDNDLLQIKELLYKKVKHKKIMEKFGISRTTIGRIKIGKARKKGGSNAFLF